MKQFLDTLAGMQAHPKNNEKSTLLAAKCRELIDQKKFSDALVYAEELFRKDITSIEATRFLVTCYLAFGRFEDVATCLNRLATSTQLPQDMSRVRADTLKRLNRFIEAHEVYDLLLKHKPNDSDLLALKLEVLLNLFESTKVMELVPQLRARGICDARHSALLTEAMLVQGKFTEAIEFCKDSIAEFGKTPELVRMLAKAYYSNGQWADVLNHTQHSLNELPNDEFLLTLQMLAVCETGDIAAYKQVHAQLKPFVTRPADFTNNVIAALIKLRLLDELEDAIETALNENAFIPGLHYNKSLLEALRGNIGQAQFEYEWWWQTESPRVRQPRHMQRWHGENLNNKTILVFTDQGVGDSFQYARFVPEIKRQYPQARVILACEDKLIKRFSAMLSDIEVIDRAPLSTTPPDGIDFVAPICFLLTPLGVLDYKKLTAIELPAVHPQPKNYKTNENDFVIGISWWTKSASSGHWRSLTLSDFSFLKDYPNVKIVSLQYGDVQEQIDAFKTETGLSVIIDETVDSWADLDSFAAQVAGCDLVISIDNTTVHFAGGQNVPCWTLLPHACTWRWHQTGETTPWYASMRLFRAGQQQQMNSVIPQVKTALDAYFKKPDSALLRPATPYTPAAPSTKKNVIIFGDSLHHKNFSAQLSSTAVYSALKEKNYTINHLPLRDILHIFPVSPSLAEFDDTALWSRMCDLAPSYFWEAYHSDAVVIDGLDSFANTKREALCLLYIAYNIKRHFKKPVYLVNAEIYPEGGVDITDPKSIAWYRKVLPLLDGVFVRTHNSQNLVEAMGIECKVMDMPSTPNVHYSADNNKVILLPAEVSTPDQKDFFEKSISALIQNGYNVTYLHGATYHECSVSSSFAAFLEQQNISGLAIEKCTTPNTWAEHVSGCACALVSNDLDAYMAIKFNVPFVLLNPARTEARYYADTLGYTTVDSTSSANASGVIVAVTKAIRKGPVSATPQGTDYTEWLNSLDNSHA